MGSKSGQAHALGCPEWISWGYGSREYVLGTLWWFLCPSAPIHTIHTYTDNISAYTCISMHMQSLQDLHVCECIYTDRYRQIQMNVCEGILQQIQQDRDKYISRPGYFLKVYLPCRYTQVFCNKYSRIVTYTSVGIA